MHVNRETCSFSPPGRTANACAALRDLAPHAHSHVAVAFAKLRRILPQVGRMMSLGVAVGLASATSVVANDPSPAHQTEFMFLAYGDESTNGGDPEHSGADTTDRRNSDRRSIPHDIDAATHAKRKNRSTAAQSGQPGQPGQQKPQDKADQALRSASPDAALPRTGMSVDELIELACRNNPTIQQSLATIAKAQGIQYQSGRMPNPVFGYQAAEVGNGGQLGQQGVYVSQVFVTADKLTLNQQVHGWDVQALVWQAQLQEMRVATDVRTRYVELLATRQRSQLLHRLQTVAENGVELTENLFTAGDIARGPLLQARIEARQRAMAVRQADLAVEAARLRLSNTIGMPQFDLSDISGSMTTDWPAIDADVSWQQLVAGSPQLAAARARVVRSQWAAQRARIDPVPNVQTQLSVQYDDSTSDTVTGIQVGVPLPVFNRNRGNIRAANADYIRTTQDVRRMELQLREQFVLEFQRYRTAIQQVDTWQNEILPLARENLQTTKDAFQSGDVSFLQFLTAQRSYVEAALAVVDGRLAVWQAVTRLQGWLADNSLSEPVDVLDGSIPFISQ